jgi:hypothetical protein
MDLIRINYESGVPAQSALACSGGAMAPRLQNLPPVLLQNEIARRIGM